MTQSANARAIAAVFEMTKRHPWSILAAVVMVNLSVLVAGPICTDEAGLFVSNSPIIRIVTIPPYWMLGSAVTVAFWIVFGAGRWYVRLAAGILAWVWLGMALIVGEMCAPNRIWRLEKLLVAGAILAFASTLLFAVQRRVLSWRLSVGDQTIPDQLRQPFRFHLMQLMLAMALIAATLGFGRLINNRYLHLFAGWEDVRYAAANVSEAAMDAIVPFLLAILAIWLMMRSVRGAAWSLIFVTPSFIVLQSLLQFAYWTYTNWTWQWFIQPQLPDMLIVYVMYLQRSTAGYFSLVCSIFVSVTALRLVGYRWERGISHAGAPSRLIAGAAGTSCRTA